MNDAMFSTFMTSTVAFTVIGLVLQQAAYVVSLSWIAWHYERRTGSDAFHLMLPLLLGVYCTWYLAGPREVPLYAASCVGAVTAVSMDAAITVQSIRSTRLPPQLLLLGSLVLTVTTLAIFEYVTGYQPLGINYGKFVALSSISGTFLATMAIYAFMPRASYIDELILGVQGRQIVQGWRQLRPYPNCSFIMSYTASWFVTVSLPVATTGITSYRLLRDIVVALVVVRLVGSRKPWLLLAIGIVIGSIRVFLSYLTVGAWAAVLVEACVIISAIALSRLNDVSRKWSDLRV